ncbi:MULTISPECIES: outer membrane lipoprotein chaperone LolA [unclassified Pseudoalteromonas]|uniref:outer membrane lipoprotein chaperone LolA n=1 Tax=unclassified Pseudoalteromonas TaxID=194690 RepID=UPI003015275F
MKKLITYSVLAMLFGSVAAQSAASPEDLQQLKDKLAGLETFQGQFSQQVMDQQGNELQRGEGNITLAQPLKIRWQQSMPDETLFIASGNTTYYYDSFAEQVTLLDTVKLIDTTPFVLLTTQAAAQWQKYEVEQNDGKYLIAPKNKVDSQVELLTLEFAANNQGLSQLQVHDISGQVSTFEFHNSKVNLPVEDSVFEFTVPDGVVVDDQRNSD